MVTSRRFHWPLLPNKWSVSSALFREFSSCLAMNDQKNSLSITRRIYQCSKRFAHSFHTARVVCVVIIASNHMNFSQRRTNLASGFAGQFQAKLLASRADPSEAAAFSFVSHGYTISVVYH